MEASFSSYVDQPFLKSCMPKDAVVIERCGEFPSPKGPEFDAGLVSDAVASRQAEFCAGRFCARLACERLGKPADFIGIGQGGAPLWPKGVVGSITHTTGYVAAAAIASNKVRYLGIDAEPALPLPMNLVAFVATTAEVETLNRISPPQCAYRVLFSAKEAVFKALWPVHHIWLDFANIEVDLCFETGQFGTKLEKSKPHQPLTGRFKISSDYIVTSVTG